MTWPPFYLGTHEPSWLPRAGFPLFISRIRLHQRKHLPRATAPWALDSGGFSVLDGNGQWDITPRQYVTLVRRYHDEIGQLCWAAPMDWMCEPRVRARTGLPVAGHQRRTTANLLDLRSLAPDLHFIPVLQGWELHDYHACADLYEQLGVDLAAEPLIGLGSVCRRQATPEIAAIVRTLAMRGLRLHGFGVKIRGFELYGPDLASADSLAWSYRGRRVPARCGTGRHRSEANCLDFATRWRSQFVTRQFRHDRQPSFWSPLEGDTT